MPSSSPFASLWTIDPGVDYLNHGSFGACPRSVQERQSALRAEMERELGDFMFRSLPSRLAAVREALGAFIGAHPDDLALLTNATMAVNTVCRSLPFAAGDELLTSDHAYGACRKTLEFVARERGARVVVARVPFPIDDERQVVDAFLAAATPRTRLALVDHVAAPTGLLFPVEKVVRALAQRGIDTLVDGAHALGMVPLDLDRLGAAYYTANAHKWLCAPKGAAFLHVRRDRQAALHPLVISHGYDPDGEGNRFRAEFDWTGTDDPTPYLAIPECISYLGSLLPGGWPELMQRNHALAVRARALLCDALDIPAPAPDAMLGSLAAIPLPAAAPGSPAAASSGKSLLDQTGLARWLRDRNVEPIVFSWPGPGHTVVRVSAQLYNHEDQYVRLGALLREALGR